MTDDLRELVAQINSHASRVHSVVASFHSHFDIFGQSFDSSGKVYFKHPASYRTDCIMNDQHIVVGSNADKLQRYLVDQNTVREVNLKELRAASAEATLPDYFRYGFSDIRQPFGAVDEASLRYGGQSRLCGTSVHCFCAKTRNDFNIQYKGVTWPVDLKLYVNMDNCLLHEVVGTKDGQENLRAHYDVEAINVPLEDSLFTVEASGPGIRKADITIMTKYLLFPSGADQGASMN